ncbi:flavo protein-like protein oxygenase [Lindgomyces ingoldianus]|uniref:Flavo protein-like protein oxygenase n=1 Tax=Lindgomyces ingoldianus TaxID=673940 RepID=A0ACB6QJZ5_9PLEO|nr:flavo protein-like protein oxygenase [Lindgomyces ingoldianus]KAF2466460.1 flavo protein-like protein oxygenase [Lindgomyces ingoldianus]
MALVSADPSAPKLDAENTVKRNPHPDFKKVEASRPLFNTSHQWHFTQAPKPNWKPGDGPNDSSVLSIPHREIDPYAEGRPAVHNYKLLISGIVPRPVGFVSTISGDGKSTNLAPFSYFNLISHDPPLFILGFSGGYNRPKDTLSNLLATQECVLNIISEHYIEAANYTSLNAPEGISEWPFSGLHPAKSRIVKPDRVQEAVFSIEAKLVETREWESRVTPGKKTGVLGVVEGVKFWVREDAVDEEGVLIDPAVLKPISRLGGITFSRTTEGFELPRPTFDEVMKDEEVAKLSKPKADSQ